MAIGLHRTRHVVAVMRASREGAKAIGCDGPAAGAGRVVGYLRADSDQMASRQQSALLAEANAREWTVLELTRDVGGAEHGPGLERALRLLGDGRCNVLMIYELSHVGRSMHTILRLREKSILEGWALVLVQ